MRGYASQGYAFSLTDFGEPVLLPASGSYILKQNIPKSERFDARALYPLFACDSWIDLPKDLDELEDSGLVSLVVVTDPFADYGEDLLHHCFPDLMRPFKRHYIVDYSQSFAKKISKHHRYYARKSLNMVEVEYCSKPETFLDEWNALYGNLIQRHRITGLQAFSRSAFEKQLSLPCMTVFRATRKGKTIGMHLWIQDKDTAYSHLTAFNDEGYALSVSYALYWYAIQYLANYVQYLDLGSGAGLSDEAKHGLSRFKRGWSNAEKEVYLCGRIFDHTAYAKLTGKLPTSEINYFPAYRSTHPD